MKKIYFTLFVITLYYCLNNNLYAQYKKDSLEKIWKNTSLSDSIRMKALSDISGYIYLNNFPDSSYLYADTLEVYARKVNNKKQLANALNLKGISYIIRGNYIKAVDFLNESLKISEEINDKNSIANTTNSLGIIFQKQENYQKALEYFYRCLSIREMLKDTIGMANTLSNIGIAQSNLGMKDEAITNYLKSIGYRKQKEDITGIANSYANIGSIYKDNLQYQLALDAYFKSLELFSTSYNLFGKGAMCINIAKIYFELDSIEKSHTYADSALTIAKTTQIIQLQHQVYDLLYKIFKYKRNYEKALNFYELAINLKDSIDNDENKKMLLQKQFEFEYERKEAKIIEEQRKQRMITIFIAVISMFIAFILFLVYRNLKQTKKQKILIENQKSALEEKQKEILDSIQYAKRIQTALLTSEYYIEKNLKRLLK